MASFTLGGYTFVEIESKNSNRPYRVRCRETGEEKDSAISSEDAASLLINNEKFSKSWSHRHDEDEAYIKRIFTEVLLGRKKSECGSLVKNEITDKKRIAGTIVSGSNQDRYVPYIEYQTEDFIVTVHFERGIRNKSTKISIKER